MSDVKAPVNGNNGESATSRIAWLVGLIVLYVVIVSLPSPAGLPIAGQRALALMVVAVVAWIKEVLPMGVLAILFTVIQHPLKIMPLGPAVENFAIPTVLFVIASFFLALGMFESGLSKRLALWLSVKADSDPKKLLTYMVCAAGAVSSVISDIPVTAAFFPIALAILQENKMEPGKSNYGKALMIGIPFAALIGGVGTPAGSSLNVLALGMLQSTAKISVPFASWAAIGIPMVIIMLPIAAWILLKMLPPEVDTLVGGETIKKEYAALGEMKTQEYKFIILLVLMLITWFTDFWHKVPLPVSTIIGTTLFFVPGIDLLTWDKVKNKISWDVILLIGATNSLGLALWKTGAAAWMAKAALGGIGSFSPLMIVVAISSFVTIIHLLVPVNNALVAVMVPALVALSVTLNMSPAYLVLPMAFTASSAFLLPLDPVPLLTYAGGYYKMTDYFKAGWPLSLVWIVVMAAAMMFIAKPMGLM